MPRNHDERRREQQGCTTFMLFLFMLMMLGNVHPPTRSQATPTAVRENNKYQRFYIYIPLRLSWMGVHVLHLVSWAMQSDSCTAVFKTCGQCAITGEREWVGFPLLFPFIHLELVFLKAPFSQNAIAYASAFLAATERWHQSRSSRRARAFRTAYQSD